MMLLVRKRYEIFSTILPDCNDEFVEVCNTCKTSINHKKIPTYSTYNGFKFPKKPEYLPPLDLISESFLSPRLPFMQIRRLRTGNGQFGIIGQIINVPVSVDTMVNFLPRSLSDYHAIDVHIKKKIIHKSSYLIGQVQKSVLKKW